MEQEKCAEFVVMTNERPCRKALEFTILVSILCLMFLQLLHLQLLHTSTCSEVSVITNPTCNFTSLEKVLHIPHWEAVKELTWVTEILNYTDVAGATLLRQMTDALQRCYQARVIESRLSLLRRHLEANYCQKDEVSHYFLITD